MKTPEEMAEEYGASPHEKDAFLAGYKAAMDEVEAYKDGAKDVAKKFNELIAAKDQVADVSKVMPQWISVKDRLPEENQEVLISYGQKPFFLIAFLYHPNHPKKDVKMFCGQNNTNYSLNYVTHWQPLPAPPQEEK